MIQQMVTGERCKTKYPLLLIHGAGHRDHETRSYWGRIPSALQKEGAIVFHGNQNAWATIEDNARLLRMRLLYVLKRTGAQKVNIIAHSKGGLDARYMISSLGMADRVASLTTVSTPHHGMPSVDIIRDMPRVFYHLIAFSGDMYFRLIGDSNPDLSLASSQLTTWYARRFNRENPNMPGVYYQSLAAVMSHPFSDIRLSIPYLIVHTVERMRNDGMVSPVSARWTNFRGVLTGATGRGISHFDLVDARRKNLSDRAVPGGVHDIRDVYIRLASELRDMGF